MKKARLGEAPAAAVEGIFSWLVFSTLMFWGMRWLTYVGGVELDAAGRMVAFVGVVLVGAVIGAVTAVNGLFEESD